VTYDLRRPKYQRIVSLMHNGNVVRDDDVFTVAAGSFLTEGGDLYHSFAESEKIRDVGKVSDVVIAYFQQHDSIGTPQRGRQLPVDD
jgi:2',3'-cyclic-nucleotide 2'-phosphodiesterase (5'-nucleotidase family)